MQHTKHRNREMQMCETLKPPRLNQGDCVLIVSPSAEILSYPKRMNKGLSALNRLGLQPILSPNALAKDGYRAGSTEIRASDIMEGFKDPSVKGIICSVGGWNAISLLTALDYSVIRDHPKVFVGFSDVTTLHSAIHAKAGLVTFHGPTLLPSFGETGDALEITSQSFVRTTMTGEPLGYVNDPGVSSIETVSWDRNDSTPRNLYPHEGLVAITKGQSFGKLLGGNLTSLMGLVGTEYFPDVTDAVLLLEEEGGNTAATERYLDCLGIHNIFDKVKGILFGRPNYEAPFSSESRRLSEVLIDVGRSYDIPILMNFMSSHALPILTVPLGARCHINTDTKSVEFSESGVI